MRDQRIYIQCPHCRSNRVFVRRTNDLDRLVSALLKVQFFKCGNCKRRFTVRRGVLEGRNKRPPLPVLVGLVLLGVGASVGGWKYWRYTRALAQSPSLIAVVGGGVPREIAAAQLAARYDNLPVVVLGGSSAACLEQIFTVERGIAAKRLLSDERPGSTLTVFTQLARYVDAEQPRNVYVVTDTGGWKRASLLGGIALGPRGIALTPALVFGPGSARGESDLKIALEALLAAAWSVFGDIVLPPGFLDDPAQIRQRRTAPGRGCTAGYASSYPLLFAPAEPER